MEPEELKTVDITVMLTMSVEVPIDTTDDILREETMTILTRDLRHTDFEIEEILIED